MCAREKRGRRRDSKRLNSGKRERRREREKDVERNKPEARRERRREVIEEKCVLGEKGEGNCEQTGERASE